VCGGTVEGSVCVLPPGVTTAPNSYSAAIAVSKTGTAGATVTFALTTGSLPPGLTMPAGSGSGTVISGNPSKAGTYNFTVKATDGGLTATLAYQITVTVQGPPDQLLCTAANGSYLSSGTCVLPDATLGVPYQGHLVTSHNAGGTLSIVAGALPAGLTLPATFGAAGDTVGGTVTQPLGEVNTYTFTVQGTGDQGQPLYQPYQITVDPNQPLTIDLPSYDGATLPPAMVGGAYALGFGFSGGAAPYTWSVASGSLPPGLALTSPYATAGDNNSQLSGTPTTAGTYTFTMQLSDYDGQQATRFPAAEEAELAEYFRDYGADPGTAARMAAAVSKDPDTALRLHTREELELERAVHRAHLVIGVLKMGFEQPGGVLGECQRPVGVPGRALHHAEGPRGPGQRGGRVGFLRGGHRPVGGRPGQLGLARPHHLVLHQGVHIGQHRVGGAAVLPLGRAGRDPGVGDQPGKDAAHVGAVLSGLVPQQPGIRRPRCQRGHVRWPGGDGQQRIADRLADGGHCVMRDVRERGQRHRGRPAQVHVDTGQDGHVADR
jgi:hypothetical protein